MITLSDSNNCLQFRDWATACKSLDLYSGSVLRVNINGSRKYFLICKDVLKVIHSTLSAGDVVHIPIAGECQHLENYDDISELLYNFKPHSFYTDRGAIKALRNSRADNRW